MSLNFFVTGTDTEIGKTYVSTLLFKHFIAKGEKPVIMKPVASAEREPSEDVEAICTVMADAGHEISSELLKHIAPITFPKPLAPYAVRNYICHDLQGKLQHSYKILEKNFSRVIVEGIGGALVPIERDFYAADIARLLGIPLVVVAEDKLGVINHSLLTLESLAARDLTVLGFVMNRHSPEVGADVRGNIEIIEELSGFPCIGKVVGGELVDCTLL